MLRKDGAVTEQDLEKEDVPNASPGLMPCIAGKLRAALDTLFNKTLSETRSWFIFCVNPNNLQAIHFPQAIPDTLNGTTYVSVVAFILHLVTDTKRNCR